MFGQPRTENKSTHEVKGDSSTFLAENSTENARRKVSRHLAKFWLWYLCANIAAFAIILPILYEIPISSKGASSDRLSSFLVVIPAIVQLFVDRLDIPIHGGLYSITAPSQSILSVSTSFTTPSAVVVLPLTARVFREAGAASGTPIIDVRVPELHPKALFTLDVPTQNVTIQNEADLITLGKAYVHDRTVDIFVTTLQPPHVSLGSLKYTPRVEKSIRLPSLDGLRGLAIVDFNLRLLKTNIDKGATPITGTAIVPNTGVLTLSVGNISVDILIASIVVARLETHNLILHAGNNTVPFTGRVFVPNIFKNIGNILALQRGPLKDGQIEVIVSGKDATCMVNGAHVRYVESILEDKQFPVRLNVIQIVSKVVTGVLGEENNSLLGAIGRATSNETLLTKIANNFANRTTRPQDSMWGKLG